MKILLSQSNIKWSAPAKRWNIETLPCISIIDDNHVPHNRRPGEVPSKLEVMIVRNSVDGWASIDLKEMQTIRVGYNGATRTQWREVGVTFSKEQAETLARFLAADLIKAETEACIKAVEELLETAEANVDKAHQAYMEDDNESYDESLEDIAFHYAQAAAVLRARLNGDVKS